MGSSNKLKPQRICEIPTVILLLSWRRMQVLLHCHYVWTWFWRVSCFNEAEGTQTQITLFLGWFVNLCHCKLQQIESNYTLDSNPTKSNEFEAKPTTISPTKLTSGKVIFYYKQSLKEYLCRSITLPSLKCCKTLIWWESIFSSFVSMAVYSLLLSFQHILNLLLCTVQVLLISK